MKKQVDKNNSQTSLPPRRLLIFAHFDSKNRVKNHVKRMMEEYSKHCERLVFVSTSKMGLEDFNNLSKFCDDIIQKSNSGYDFGSWKRGLQAQASIDQYDELILANDSVYGPLHDTATLFERVSNLGYDICGLTSNWQFGWHIQSYFVCYKRKALATEAFKVFWDSVLPQDSKMDVVQRYEVGLTQAMRSAGISLGALIEPPFKTPFYRRMLLWICNISLNDRRRTMDSLRHLYHETQINPVHYRWRSLIKAGIPFIKRELLSSNPLFVNLENVYRRYPELRGKDFS